MGAQPTVDTDNMNVENESFHAFVSDIVYIK